MAVHDSFEKYYAEDRKTWRKWLEKNHAKVPGIWLIYYKKNSGKTRVPYADAVEEAICFGWIDTTQRPGDSDYYMQLFMPRKPKSNWSKLNKDRSERLIKEGLMMPAGLKSIETAKNNGSWELLDGVESLTPMPELQKALNKNKTAMKHFESLSTWNRKYILYWVNGAKRSETRAERIAVVMEALSRKDIPERFKRQKP